MSRQPPRARIPSKARLLELVRSQGGDAGWTVIDQGLSAGSNLAVGVAAGRAGGEQLLGEFTVAFSVYLLAMGFSRALFSEPLLSLPVQQGQRAERAAVTCVAVGALATGGVVALAGALLSSSVLIAVGLVLPALLVQDLLRFVAIRVRRARRAAALDGIWVLALLLTWPILTATRSAAVLVLLWGAGAAAAALYGLIQTPPASLRASWRWWHTDARRVGGLLVVDSVVHSLAAQATVFGLVGLLGASALGQLRAAQLLLGPASTLLVAFNSFVLPRLTSRGSGVPRRLAVQLSVLSAGAAVVAVAVSVLAAPLLEQLFFGDVVSVPLGFLLLVALLPVVTGASAGFVLHLKAMRDLRTWTAFRVTLVVLQVPLVLGAAHVGGLDRAVQALVLQALIVTCGDVLAWRLTLRSRARSERGQQASGPDVPLAPGSPQGAPEQERGGDHEVRGVDEDVVGQGQQGEAEHQLDRGGAER